MKVSDQKGGGECVLIKIKSAQNTHTHKIHALFLYVFVYLAELMCVCFA